MFEGSLIYSRHYPSIFEQANLYVDAPPTDDEIATANMEINPDELLLAMARDTVFVPKPEKIRAGERAMQLAKELSELHRVDLDIYQKPDALEFQLHLLCFEYTGMQYRMIMQLLALCDTMRIAARPRDPDYVTLSLSCRTHDCRRKSRTQES